MRGIDESKVGAWLIDHIDGVTPPLRFVLIAGGRSNLTVAVTDAAGRRLVVRRPPLGHVLATAHDMAREYRLISALAPTPVPVAPALGLCTDERVNDAPFYVMAFVDGIVLDGADKAAPLSVETRRRASEQLIDALADLHAVDVDAVGLGDLARRDGYIERQLKRWSVQWESSKTRELPAIEEVEQRLRARVPTQVGTAIVHGDYRFGNCLVDPETGTLTAVLDWELCTLGDALADLGYLGVYWAGPRQGQPNDPTGAGGFLDYDQVLERYGARTGRDLSAIDYYLAFSAWRMAVISEGVYARYLHGGLDDEVDLDVLRERPVFLAEQALAATASFGRGTIKR
jgi:aminoglycoside phosphotransferase (APT) family kinase protein